MTAPAWKAGQGSPGAAQSTGSQGQARSWAPSYAHMLALQFISKGLPKWKRHFYFKSIQKKKPKKTKNPDLWCHIRKGREGRKKISCKTRNAVEGVLWYKGTIQYEHITYIQPCQQHGVLCSVQSGARHPHQGLQTESAVPGGGPGGEAAVAAVGGPPYRGSTAPPGAKAVLGMRKANCPSEAGSSWKPPYTLAASAPGLQGMPGSGPVPLPGGTSGGPKAAAGGSGGGGGGAG